MSNWELRDVWPADSVAFGGERSAWSIFHPKQDGFSLHVNGVHCNSVEALYQAIKFHDSDDQCEILDCWSSHTSADTARRLPGYWDIHHDLPRAAYLMHFALWTATCQHSHYVVPFLRMSDPDPIVYVAVETAWGAQPDHGRYRGTNALGRLWMDIRDVLRSHEWRVPDPLPVACAATLMNRPVWYR